MKFQASILLSLATAANAFAPSAFGVRNMGVSLDAEIRGPTEKSDELRFGELHWQGMFSTGLKY